MKESPILFSTPMVQAILEDRKTITRRVIKQAAGWDHNWNVAKINEEHKDGIPRYEMRCGSQYGLPYFKCPYGKPGDLLWVRESFQWMEGFAGSGYYVFKADFSFQSGEWVKETPKKFHDQEVVRRWRPSIRIPKEAARLWLQVTDIRVERLQDISEEDAIAEGVKSAHCESNEECPSSLCKDGCTAKGEWWNYLEPQGEGFPAYSAKESYESLWRFINGSESWEANPWVWVVSYQVLSKNGKPEMINP